MMVTLDLRGGKFRVVLRRDVEFSKYLSYSMATIM